MARTVNQCVEAMIGNLGLQVAVLQAQLEAANEMIAKLQAEIKSNPS